jgi:hypothetical protein
MLSVGDLFKGHHFDREIIMLCVRWYRRFSHRYVQTTVEHDDPPSVRRIISPALSIPISAGTRHLVGPDLQRGVGVPSVHTDDWQSLVAQLVPQPHSQRASLHPDANEIRDN